METVFVFGFVCCLATIVTLVRCTSKILDAVDEVKLCGAQQYVDGRSYLKAVSAAHAVAIAEVKSLIMQNKVISDAEINGLSESIESAIAELEAMTVSVPCEEDEDTERAFKLDDAGMQAGIANLMGYDPFARARKVE